MHLPDIFPPFLSDEVPKHHGVVACEGSMFKSKFANALATMMIGSLGIAAAENKLSVGYGAEAGHMDPLLRKMCAPLLPKFAGDHAQRGISNHSSSNWACRRNWGPIPPGRSNRIPLSTDRKPCGTAGWDGSTPVLVVCPINPFEWPVKASVAKYALHGLTGAYKDSHYRSVYFHNSGPAADRAYQHYLTAIANAVDAFRKQRKVFVILVATERLDARPANRIAEKLGGVPVLTSEEYNIYELVSVLRACHMMASSRYHGIVTSMPALVPSAGITMDERIRNLMHERGHAGFADERGRCRPGAKTAGGAGKTGDRGRTDCRRDRAHGGAQSESHGAHGRVL